MLLLNTLMTKHTLLRALGQKSWKNYHFSPRHTKLRILQDIRRVRTTDIERAMTIFEHCHNVLNNEFK